MPTRPLPPRRVPLAWRNLSASMRRLSLSIAGIMFAVALMFAEIGFKNALLESSTELIRHLDGHIFLISSARDKMASPLNIPRRRLIQAASHPDVAAAYPLYLHLAGHWRNPVTGKRIRLRVLGIDPDQPVFLDPEIQHGAPLLKRDGVVLMDARSRRHYGPMGPGLKTELQGKSVELAGLFEIGVDFVVEGTVITSERTFFDLFPSPVSEGMDARAPSIGLLKITGGRSPEAVALEIASRLPGDVKVLTKSQFFDWEKSYWTEQSAIGPVFNLATVIGFIVGFVICYQILFTDISDQLPQFATLKAMGYSNRRLVSTVLNQAFYLAVLSYAPACLASYGLYRGLDWYTGLVMRMPGDLIIGMFFVTVVMCEGAAVFAVRRVLSLDPAELF